MRHLFLALAMLSLPHLVAAAPLRVQTGEHADFTRVVIGMPPDSDWQIGRTAEGYGIRLPTDEGYVLDEFFALIPRDRIAAVSQIPGEGELRLRILCDCHAEASVYLTNFLVIDILDGPPPPNSPLEIAFDTPDEAVAEVSPRQRLGQPYRPASNRLLPLVTPRIAAAAADTPVKNESVQDTAVAPPATPVMDADAADEALRMIAQSLTESVGRGLTEGVLREGLSTASARRAITEGSGAPLIFESIAFPGVNARTSIDPLAVADEAAPPQTQGGESCLPDAAFDIASWGKGDPPDRQLNAARGRLAAEDEQFAESALLDLARLYVFLGFGREAQQVLALEGGQSQDRMILRTIARIIDDEGAAHDVFAGQVSCPTNAALWALLAQPAAATDAKVDRTAVLNAYRSLPRYVQQAIAPRLTEALLAIGAEDAALQVMAGQTASTSGDIALALAEVSLADALGEAEQAEEKIKQVARNAPRTSPEAIARFFKEGASRGVAFLDDDFLLADALRFEIARTPDAVVLADAQFLAYLSVDRFEEARALLGGRRDAPSSQTLVDAQAALYQQAAQRMADAAFLEFVWRADMTTKDAQTQNIVAERLLALGFPARALAVLSAPARGDLAAQQNALLSQARQSIEANRQVSTETTNEIVRDVPVSADSNGANADAFMPFDRPTLRDSRALIDTAVQSRDNIRALLQSVPAPSDF